MRVKCAQCGDHVPHDVVLEVGYDGDAAYFCSTACVDEAEREGRIPVQDAPPLPPPPRRILVASDGSGPSRRAVQHAAALARATGGSVEILRAIGGQLRALGLGAHHQELLSVLDEQAARHLARERGICEAAGVPCTTRVVADPPLEAILAAAEDADLLVMGSRGAGASIGNVLGGLSQRIVGATRTPVMAVH